MNSNYKYYTIIVKIIVCSHLWVTLCIIFKTLYCWLWWVSYVSHL